MAYIKLDENNKIVAAIYQMPSNDEIKNHLLQEGFVYTDKVISRQYDATLCYEEEVIENPQQPTTQSDFTIPVPDYTQGISRNVGTTYTAEEYGVMEIEGTKYGSDGSWINIAVNGVTLGYSVDAYGHTTMYRTFKPGDVYTVTIGSKVHIDRFAFFPIRY